MSSSRRDKLDGVFEEAFKKVTEPVEQHPLGMGGFEFHVVAEHRGELLRGDLAVVRPGREIVVAVGVVIAVVVVAAGGFGMLLLFLALKLALTGALLGVLRELEIIELIERTFFF